MPQLKLPAVYGILATTAVAVGVWAGSGGGPILAALLMAGLVVGAIAWTNEIAATQIRRIAREAGRLGREDGPTTMPAPSLPIYKGVHAEFERLANALVQRSAEPAQLRNQIRDLEKQLDEERARLEERLAQRTRDLQVRSELAVTDELTGVPNRREAMNKLQLLWSNRRMYADPLSIIMLDIDHFKAVNDNHGHAFGDVVLKQTADILRANLRATDTVCRIGGEEFMVLCAQGGLEAAAACAEKLRLAVEAHTYTTNGQTLRATISLGVAERNKAHEDPSELMREADECLYDAKNTGRNRVVTGRSAKVDEEDASASERRGKSTEKRAIMVIVSEDTRVRRDVRKMAAGEDYEIVECRFNAAMTTLTSAASPAMIVIDPPDVAAGTGLIRRIRKDPRNATTVVVALLASVIERDVQALTDAGADLVLDRNQIPQGHLDQAASLARLHVRLSSWAGPANRGDEQSRVLSLLLDFSHSLNEAFTLNAVLARSAAAAAELTGCRKAAILLADERGTGLTLGAEVGLSPAEIAFVTDGLAVSVLNDKKSIVINLPAEGYKASPTEAAAVRLGRPAILHPLTAAAASVGVLWIADRPNGQLFESHALETLDQLCNMAAAAIADALSRKARDQAQDSIVAALGKLAEYRDDNTGRHVERVTRYSILLAEQLRNETALHYHIDEQFLRDLRRSVPLHDIGKVGIPDEVLLKPRDLTLQQRAIMRTHVKIGVETIRSVAQCVPGADYLRMAEDIAASHHEWYNGGGYPAGLKGRAIPLAARIVAIADVYDALTTRRPYKPPYSHEESVAIICKASGTQFDPDLIAAFRKCDAQFAMLAAQLADDDAPPPVAAPVAAQSATRDTDDSVQCYDLAPS